MPELLTTWDRRPKLLLGDKGYDADWLREDLLTHGIEPVIPFRNNRATGWPLDRDAYRLRNRIERMIAYLKQWRRVATRYEKTACAYLSMIHLAATRLWL